MTIKRGRGVVTIKEEGGVTFKEGMGGASRGFNLISLQGDLEEILDEKNPTAFKVLNLLGGPDRIARIQKIDSALGLIKEARFEGDTPAGEDFSIAPGDGLIVYGKMDTVIPYPGYNPSTGRFDTAVYENVQPVGLDFPIVPGEGYFIYMEQERLGFRP